MKLTTREAEAAAILAAFSVMGKVKTTKIFKNFTMQFLEKNRLGDVGTVQRGKG